MKKMNNNFITIMAQGFYGNRTITEIRKEEVDRFVLGYLDDKLKVREPINRTIIRVPGAEHIAIIYNKYEEEDRLKKKKTYFEMDGYVLKPLSTIPEYDLEIYSRCIVCRINEADELESLRPEDYELFIEYLAD